MIDKHECAPAIISPTSAQRDELRTSLERATREMLKAAGVRQMSDRPTERVSEPPPIVSAK